MEHLHVCSTLFSSALQVTHLPGGAGLAPGTPLVLCGLWAFERVLQSREMLSFLFIFFTLDRKCAVMETIM